MRREDSQFGRSDAPRPADRPVREQPRTGRVYGHPPAGARPANPHAGRAAVPPPAGSVPPSGSVPPVDPGPPGRGRPPAGPVPPPPGSVPPPGPPSSGPPPFGRRRAPVTGGPRPPAVRTSRRAAHVGVLVAVLVLALAIAGVVVLRPGPVAGWIEDGSARPAQGVESPPPPVLTEVRPDAPMPTPDGIRAALDPLIAASGVNGMNLSVLDVATGQSLYDRGSDTMTMPASTTKLATAAAVLSTRGPGFRISTRAVAGSVPGEVVLVGGGDPTLAVGATGSYRGAGRLDQLAEQVRRTLGGQAPTKVTIDVALFTGPRYEPGWDSATPTEGYGAAITALMTDGARVNPRQATGQAQRVSEPDMAAGRSFARLLGVSPDTVTRGTAPAATASPAAAGTPGAELGRVESPPMLRLVEDMLGESDNVVAEFLARQVALARNQPASFAGAAAAVDAVLADLGLDAGQIALADGSGLSRTNRITPAALAKLLALTADPAHPELAGIAAGLPVAAWSGTLRDRYGTRAGGSSAAGVVRAKTGTLSGVHSLAGMVTTADGRLLAFAIMADNVPYTLDVRPRMDRMAATLAGCGCR